VTPQTKTTLYKPSRLPRLDDEISVNIRIRKTARISMRTMAQAAVWTWIILSVGWLAMVAWVAIVEPMNDAALWAYAMTALVPPVSLLVFGAALTWTTRALFRRLSPYLLRLAFTGS
jgi:hypothetical protein